MSIPKIYIYGLGVNSAIGLNVSQNWDSLMQSKTGIGKLENFVSKRGNLPVGEIKQSNEELKNTLSIDDNDPTSRTAMLGLLAAKEALEQVELSEDEIAQMGFVSATTVGGMSFTEQIWKQELDEQETEKLVLAAKVHEAGHHANWIANKLGIKGYVNSISTACSSSTNAIIHGANLLKSKKLKHVLVGGSDALSKFTLNGFQTLMILDENPSTPFDEDRKGLNLGEGAGYLLLSSDENLKGEKIAELVGYANANDAFHQTASSPEGVGAFLAMKKSLQMAGVTSAEVDYINVHGTGTEVNDASEGVAVKRLFEGNSPNFSSTKGFTGHTLAACGGIEAVYSILALVNNTLLPNLRFKNAIKAHGMVPVTSPEKKENMQYALSNSFGFGGNTSSVLFKKVK